ncbi:MAG TPA: hypothetical protein VHD69_00710 [Candidatus Paceibacterota bacterium]|nr:hypothetical protein [Candidatus Paceibacterota bacterium]
MRDVLKTRQGKLAARRRKRAAFLLLFFLAAAGITFSVLSFVSQLDSLSIQSVAVRGNVRIPTEAIENIVLEKLTGNDISFFSRRNIYLYPKGPIVQAVALLPAVASVEASRDGGTLVISVHEREEAALWCAGLTQDTGCFSMDAEGYIFAEQPREDPKLFRYRGLIYDMPIGKRLLPTDQFRNIGFFMNELAGLSVEPREAILSGTSTLIYMTISLEGGGKLIVNSEDDLSTVLSNVAAVISNKAVAPSLSVFLASLDYMKLDIGNKIVYKLKSR